MADPVSFTARKEDTGSNTLLERMLDLHPRSIDLSLGRIEGLLARLGNPHRSIPPAIHIAGTNGKGSTAAFLRAILEAHGKAVHVYTSPHLVRFHERIRLAGRLISEDGLEDMLTRVMEVNAGAPITFFEITTAAAFLAFSEVPADFTILEVGLGGRMDATNVIENPSLTLITPVAHDHQDFLGRRLGEIAAEKAGILKPGVPCIASTQRRAVRKTIHDLARGLDAPLHEQGRDWAVVPLGGGEFRYEHGDIRWPLPRPGLEGEHQIQNAGAAIRAAEYLLGSRLDRQAVAKAMGAARWPGRLQSIHRGRLYGALADGASLVLDGAHNAAAAANLAHVMQGRIGRRPFHLVVGLLANRSPASFLRPLVPLGPAVHAVPMPTGHKGQEPQDICRAARKLGLAARPHANLLATMQHIGGLGGEAPLVLIAGSLYLAGEVLSESGFLPE